MTSGQIALASKELGLYCTGLLRHSALPRMRREMSDPRLNNLICRYSVSLHDASIRLLCCGRQSLCTQRIDLVSLFLVISAPLKLKVASPLDYEAEVKALFEAVMDISSHEVQALSSAAEADHTEQVLVSYHSLIKRCWFLLACCGAVEEAFQHGKFVFDLFVDYPEETGRIQSSWQMVQAPNHRRCMCGSFVCCPHW